MKKFITATVSLFACAMLVFTILAPASALAAGSAMFDMNNVDGVSAGSEFSVTLRISGDYEFHSLNLAVSFDPASLEFVSLDKGQVLTSMVPNKSGISILEYQGIVAQGLIKLAIAMPLDAMSGSGDIFTMKFRVRDGVTVNQQVILTVFELSYMPLGTMTGTPVKFETHNSIITISGAANPTGGFNQGESGTPVPGRTQVPTIIDSAPPSVKETSRPINSVQPTETGSVAEPTESSEEATDSVSPNITEAPTEAPLATYPPTATAVPDSEPGGENNGVKPVVYVLGAAVLACVAAVIAVTVKKKKTNNMN